MKKDTKKNISLGIFIIAGLLLLIAVVYYIGSSQQLFGDKVKITATFKNVSGLQSGNTIRFSGIKIGTVKRVEIASDSTASAVLMISSSSSQFIKKDAYATIVSDGLMGNKIVSISSGSTEARSIEDGDTIRTREPVSLDDVVASFKKTSDNAQELTDNLVVISNQIKNAKGVLGKVVSDTLLAQRVSGLLTALETSSRNTADITREIEIAASRVNSGNGVVSRALNDTVWVNQVDQVLDSVQYAGSNLATASRQLELFMKKLNENKGMIDQLLNDSVTARHLDETIYNLKKGTDDLDNVMQTIDNSWILNLFTGNKKEEKKQKKKNQP